MNSVPDDKTAHDPFAVLRISEYRFFMLGRMCLTLALQIQAVVVGWQVYDLTKDPLALGLIGLCEAIPSITVALYAGHIADLLPRRRIILICDSALALCAAALLSFTLPFGIVEGRSTIIGIFTVIFVSGIARGFTSPATFAFATQIVPPRLFANASTWNSTIWHFASVVGPAAGGLIYGFGGVSAAYSVDLTLTIVSILFFLATKARPAPAALPVESIWHSLFAGVRFVFKNQILLGALSLDLFAVLFGGAVALLPVFAGDILKVGPEGLGLLRASPSAGAVLMALFLAYNPLRAGAGRLLLGAVSVFGVCMIVFALSSWAWLSMLALAVSGAVDNISVVIRHTVVQTLTPENMRGRVSSVNSIFIGSSNEIGAFESGLAAKLLGVVPSVIFGALITQVVVVITAWRAPKLRELDMTTR